MQTALCEIERKFLVRNDSFLSMASSVSTISQGYLSRDPERTVRARLRDEKGFLTVKGKTDSTGTSRFEWEKEIPAAEARALLALCLPVVIEKQRYIVPYCGLTFEVDVFHGAHEGLVLAEVELSSPDQPVSLPPFVGEEVTGNLRYYNAWLSQDESLGNNTTSNRNTTMTFTTNDLKQLAQRGISVEQAERQLRSFQTGFPALDIVSAATPGNGILCPTEKETEEYQSAWDDYLKENHKILKFVPASGAASRMFKDLFAFRDGGEETAFIRTFFADLAAFAFYPELQRRVAEKGVQNDKRAVVSVLLDDMQYGHLPKGLLLFHRYPAEARTPALEHLVEGALYAANTRRNVNLHFTISPEHRTLFEQHIAQYQDEYAQRYGVHYSVSFSEQKASTDTIAADADGNPFRDADGKLVFRPGGHGALIENLAEQDADIVFLKNIDNVVPDRLKEPTVYYKRLLAGVLVRLQQKTFAYLADLEKPCSQEKLDEIRSFIEHGLCCKLQGNTTPDILKKKLNRPVRVCGMVRNLGEPGGGPFLVRGKDGSVQCQILESSQIADKSLMQKATHFNPVDLVCGLRNCQGKTFDLKQYIDRNTAFISQKSKDGRALQALELPGLWNGAMADWNTVFVEVPVETFNPVKTVNDLLRLEHKA